MAITTPIRHHPVVSFVALSYALSWCLLPWGGFIPTGVAIAAITVVSMTEGRAGLRRLGSRVIRWRVAWRWYAAALGVPLLVHALAITLNRLAGAPAPSWSQFSPWYSVPLVLVLAMIDPLGGPLGEEPGWRGFAQPALQSGRSRLQATAILALVVTGWHVPLVVVGEFGMRPIDLASTVAVTFWYAWLFTRSGGSVLLTLIAHATEGSINTSDLWSGAPDASREQWCYFLAWTTLAVVLLVLDRRFWRGADTKEPPERLREDVATGPEPEPEAVAVR